jgi:VanZ family protein
LLAAVIYYASGQSKIAGPNVVGFDKVAHFFVFGLLATLIVRIPALAREGRLPVLWAIVAASLYGLTDEVHQSFTPGRDVDAIDWVVDTAGAALAVFVYRNWNAYRGWLEAGIARRIEAPGVAPAESSP